MAKIVVNITCAKDNPDKATVAMVIANAALVSGQDVVVFLSTEGVCLGVKSYTDDMNEEGFPPMPELMSGFLDNGGTMWVCTPCFKKRKYAESDLIEGAKLVGGATLVEALAQGAASISY
jgi:predicted peroxiredoxin